MNLRQKITLGCVAAALLFIAGCFVHGYYVNRHFERGSAQIYGVVTSVAVEHHPERSYRVNHRLVRNAAYTETVIEYAYMVEGVEYQGKTSTRRVIPRRPSAGDSIRLTYALDDPSLSRTGSEPVFKHKPRPRRTFGR